MSGAELLKSNGAEIRLFWQQKDSDCEPAVNKRNTFYSLKIHLVLIYSGEGWRCDRDVSLHVSVELQHERGNKRQTEDRGENKDGTQVFFPTALRASYYFSILHVQTELQAKRHEWT